MGGDRDCWGISLHTLNFANVDSLNVVLYVDIYCKYDYMTILCYGVAYGTFGPIASAGG